MIYDMKGPPVPPSRPCEACGTDTTAADAYMGTPAGRRYLCPPCGSGGAWAPVAYRRHQRAADELLALFTTYQDEAAGLPRPFLGYPSNNGTRDRVPHTGGTLLDYLADIVSQVRPDVVPRDPAASTRAVPRLRGSLAPRWTWPAGPNATGAQFGSHDWSHDAADKIEKAIDTANAAMSRRIYNPNAVWIRPTPTTPFPAEGVPLPKRSRFAQWYSTRAGVVCKCTRSRWGWTMIPAGVMVCKAGGRYTRSQQWPRPDTAADGPRVWWRVQCLRCSSALILDAPESMDAKKDLERLHRDTVGRWATRARMTTETAVALRGTWDGDPIGGIAKWSGWCDPPLWAELEPLDAVAWYTATTPATEGGARRTVHASKYAPQPAPGPPGGDRGTV